MKKFMRIALVFALAGAALVGCTKDYSGDISDLNKEVSAIQSTLTSLQTSIQGAQSAADAAAATANTALSAAKAAATADDLKAVQTALAAAATSADLTAVDAKYAAYIPAIEAAAKVSDLEALETAITAAIAATDVKVADLEKAFEAYAKKANLDEAVTKLGELETNYITLEARVAKLEAAEKEIRDLIAENKAGIEANAEDIAALQKKVEELLAQVDGAFSIKGVSQANQVNYYWAKWNPKNTKAEKEYFNKLANKFPELKEIEKDEVVASCTNVPFIVTPATLEFDETDSFSLVDINGKDFGWTLGKPFASPANVKAGTAGVWFAKVLAPAYNENGTIKDDSNSEMALFVERADGAVAQTSFDYTVKSEERKSEGTIEYTVAVLPANTAYKAGDFENHAYDLKLKDNLPEKTTVYDNYYIIEPTSKVEVEKYGVSVDGKTLTVENLPKAGESIELTFTKTAIMLDGRTAKSEKFTVKIDGDAISANATLADTTVTLGYNAKENNYLVNVDYAVKDFGFSALEWDVVYEALIKAQTGTGTTLSANALNEEDDHEYNDDIFNASKVTFVKKDGKTTVSGTGKSEDVAYIRITVDSRKATPGEYSVKITDGKVFCAVGNVTVKNPAAKPIKLADKLCEDGVLQIVGNKPTSGKVEYDLIDAFVLTTGQIGKVTSTDGTDYFFKDVAYVEAEAETENQEEVRNWIDGNKFSIPINGNAWDGSVTTDEAEKCHLLNTEREFVVYFNWFKNGNQNIDSLHFKAQAVSPIWTKDGANIKLNTDATKGGFVKTIYYVKKTDATTHKTVENNTVTLSPAHITGGTWAAGAKKGYDFVITLPQTATVEENGTWEEADEPNIPLLNSEQIYHRMTAAIPHSNVAVDRYVPLDLNGLPIEISLEDVYAANLNCTNSAQGNMTLETYQDWKADEDFHYYLTRWDWVTIMNAFTSVYAYGWTYNGAPVGRPANDDIAGPWKESQIKELNTAAANKIADDKQLKKRVALFNALIARIDYGDDLITENVFVPGIAASAEVALGPEELAKKPFFSVDEEVINEYREFATIDATTTPGAVTITAVTTNPAGRKTIVIPVYANVVDKWGMTTKQKVEITLQSK